jgi:hypothetical protein
MRGLEKAQHLTAPGGQDAHEDDTRRLQHESAHLKMRIFNRETLAGLGTRAS